MRVNRKKCATCGLKNSLITECGLQIRISRLQHRRGSVGGAGTANASA